MDASKKILIEIKFVLLYPNQERIMAIIQRIFVPNLIIVPNVNDFWPWRIRILRRKML